MAEYGITTENLVSAFPEPLTSDKKIHSIVYAIASLLAQHAEDLNCVSFFRFPDRIPAALLDELAKDFKIDWWSGDYSAEEKLDIFKKNWIVHKKLGTKEAVETAISSLYPDTKVIEWQDYGGDPFHFKLQIDSTYQGVDPERHSIVLSRIRFYKNLRSVLDAVEYVSRGGTSTLYTAAAVSGLYAENTLVAHAY